MTRITTGVRLLMLWSMMRISVVGAAAPPEQVPAETTWSNVRRSITFRTDQEPTTTTMASAQAKRRISSSDQMIRSRRPTRMSPRRTQAGSTQQPSQTRAVFGPLEVRLSPWCSDFSREEDDSLFFSVRDALNMEIRKEVSALDNGLEYLYADVCSIRTSTNPDSCEVLVEVGTGVMVFDDPFRVKPSAQEMNKWVQNSMEDRLILSLPPRLREGITGVAVIKKTEPVVLSQDKSSQDGGEDEDDVENDPYVSLGGGELPLDGDVDNDTNSRGRVVVVSSVCIALVSIFSLVAVFVTRVRQRFVYPFLGEAGENSSADTDGIVEANDILSASSSLSIPETNLESMDSPDSGEHRDMFPVWTSTSLATPPEQQHMPHQAHQYRQQQQQNSNVSRYDIDNRSYADGSESSFTVASEAGDSMAIKSIPHQVVHPDNSTTGNGNGSWASSARTPTIYRPPGNATSGAKRLERFWATVSPESFEYDRPVNLRKDMLTSAWSGRVPPVQDDSVRNNSVLQPSFFSASQERRRRRLEDGSTSSSIASSSGSGSCTSPSPPSQQRPPATGTITSPSNVVGTTKSQSMAIPDGADMEYASNWTNHHHNNASQPWSDSPQRLHNDSISASAGFVFTSANAGEEVIMIPPRAKSRHDMMC